MNKKIIIDTNPKIPIFPRDIATEKEMLFLNQNMINKIATR